MRTIIHSFLIVLGSLAICAAERPAQTIVITAKPTFEQRGKLVDLVVSDTNHSCAISWGMPPDVQFMPVSLDTNRVYAFTVALKPSDSATVPELRRVQMEGRTIYDIEVCEVHKTRMELKEVPIVHGLVRPGPGAPTSKTEQQLFPHRREVSFGGCVTMPDSPKTEPIYVCSECKKAYGKWKAENQETE